MFNHESLDRMFRPRSIAIVGASTNPQKIGGLPVAHLLQYGFDGKIFPVNPNASEVQGLRAYPALAALGEPVDLAIVAVPVAQAELAIRDAAEAGVRSVVLFTSGFAETGDEGSEVQKRLAHIARTHGVRVLGPNCLGFISVRENVYATFSAAPAHASAIPGAVGMVSQSGAFGMYGYMLTRERNIGLSYWISTGNECDFEFSDAVAWLARDPHTRVIMGYMEGCRDGEKLKAALALAREAGKPVVITKVGRSASGAIAAASHTAALAGDDAVFDAVLRQYGAIRTNTIDEFFNAGYVLSKGFRPVNSSVGVMTLSGGVGALIADDASDAGLTLSGLPAAAQAEILARVPFAAPRNPVDMTGQVTSEPELMLFGARKMLDEGGYGSLLGFFAAAGTSAAFWPHLLEFARTIRSEYPHVALVMCSLFDAQRREALEELGCFVLADPSAAVRAIKYLCHGVGSVARAPCDTTTPRLRIEDGVLDEPAGLAVLRSAGIPVVAHKVASNADDAARIARELGYPVVMKIVSGDITHKSDVGGVKVGLQDETSLRAACDEIHGSIARHAPDAVISGVLVAKMVKEGVECILGVQRDPVFGPVVMFGLGGILVEAIGDVTFRVAPFGLNEARSMIDEIKSRKILDGMRGRPAVDLDALAQTLATLSQFAWAARDSIESVDINPFVALPRSQGALALDAVVIARNRPNAEDRMRESRLPPQCSAALV
ncbi:acetate--CoA ligase family protein [Paraburkholderia sediminicola]|uniref:acetate--CoA ligase family protein n=1 Tax=Paraburkholderia sediminicola TaxID=458836 RepID=UPI0038BB75FB